MDQKLLLLGLLRGQEMHGYQLYEFLERYLNTCTDIKKPTAYYLLNKMAQDGWLEENHFQGGSRPPRKVYHLTSNGETRFQQLLRESLINQNYSEYAGSLGMAFLDALEKNEALELLKQRHESINQILIDVKAAPKHKGSLNIVVEYQLQRLRFELDWLSGIIEQFQQIVAHDE